MNRLDLVGFDANGFGVCKTDLSELELSRLRSEVNRLVKTNVNRGGVRNVLVKSRVFRLLGESSWLKNLAGSLLDRTAILTNLTIFDKNADANWKVPFHQDVTVAVADRLDTPGFGPWSIKDGVVHVQPPISILEQMITLRLHLDAATEDNGTLRVVAGTHKQGRLTRLQIDRARGRAIVHPVSGGSVMCMSPLLLHASSVARQVGHRRILHYQFAGCELPNGLQWAEKETKQ